MPKLFLLIDCTMGIWAIFFRFGMAFTSANKQNSIMQMLTVLTYLYILVDFHTCMYR